jgi:hypothetical protein
MPARIIDSLRSGAAPALIRRKAACGQLPVSVAEKIEILVLLSADSDAEIRSLAGRTLREWNGEDLKHLLSDGVIAPDVLKHLAQHLVPERPELMEALLANPSAPPEILAAFQEAPAAAAEEPAAAEDDPADSPAEGDKPEKQRVTLLQRIGAMTPAQKIKTALTGNQEERLALIRDSNKLVSRAVLQSPKLSDGEVEAYASMKNVTEEVLRLIAMNRAFMKSYSVVRALINNPRTPIDVGLPLLPRLNERDLKGLAINKNVAETLRGLATKMIKQRQEAQRVKLPEK